MAFKNSYDLYINGINYTHYAAMPLKIGQFLDEQLDEASISLRRFPISVIAPMTPVEIVLHNTLYFGEHEEPHDETKYFVVADCTSTENPIGSGRYDLELYLIEVTKVAERVVVDSITYTNSLGNDYLSQEIYSSPDMTTKISDATSSG